MQVKKPILITGADGYIGKSLCNYFYENDIPYKTITRKENLDKLYNNNLVCDLSKNFDLVPFMTDCSALIHLAAKVHDFKGGKKSTLDIKRVNYEATKQLAIQASKANLHHFIFFSTAGVYGKETDIDQPVSELSECKPEDPYSISKLAAENSLIEICKQEDLVYTILRPPMIYGKEAPGNWNRLVKLLKLGLPVPFGSINNKRSFLSISNLLDFMNTLLDSTNGKNEIFLISDDDDVSTTDMVEMIKLKKSYTFTNLKVSSNILQILFLLTGKSKTSKQLTKNLQLDITKSKEDLGWKPPFSFKEGINKAL